MVLLLVVPEALGMDGLTEIGKSAIEPVFIKSERSVRGGERERESYMWNQKFSSQLELT